MSAKITIVKVTGVTYRRSRAHVARLIAQGTHFRDGKVVREFEPRQIFVLRDRVFSQSPRTSIPPEFLPFNFPLPYSLLVNYQ